nr:uncharacterized protein LOC127316208 [Lolium perenne]
MAEAWTERKKARRSTTAAQSLGTNSCAPCQPPRAREEASRAARAGCRAGRAPPRRKPPPRARCQDARRPAPSRAEATAATTARTAAGRSRPCARAKTEPPRAISRRGSRRDHRRAVAEPAAPRAPSPRRSGPARPGPRHLAPSPCASQPPQDGAARAARLASRASCATGGARPRHDAGREALLFSVAIAALLLPWPAPRRRTRAAPRRRTGPRLGAANGARRRRRTGLR